VRGISRSLLRLARWSIGWFPAALVLFLGLTHLYQLGLFMLAPGQPIWVQYDGQGGPAEIRAESYSVDPWTATARVNGLRWGKPGQEPQVTLDQGRVEWSGEAVQIDAGTVLARVSRRKGDKWSFNDLLFPQGEPTGEETPITLRTDRLRLVYRDEMGAEAVGGIFDVDALDLERTQGQTTAAMMLRGGPFGRAEMSLLARDDGYGWMRSDVRAADIVAAVRWADPWLAPADRKPLAPFSGRKWWSRGAQCVRMAWPPGAEPPPGRAGWWPRWITATPCGPMPPGACRAIWIFGDWPLMVGCSRTTTACGFRAARRRARCGWRANRWTA